ncbi:MAG TPA: PAS domain S-box protein [Abditibacteriaceae bacterium]
MTGSLASGFQTGGEALAPHHAPFAPLLRGVLMTLAAIVGVETFNTLLFPIPNPAPIYMTAIVFAAYSGGLQAGLLSALLTLLYVAYSFSSDAGLFHYTRDNAVRVTVLLLTTPPVVLMVGLLQRQARMHAQIQNSSRALKQSKEWLATTLQSIGDAVITTDTKGCITFMNPMAEQLTGWSEEEACEHSIDVVCRLVDERTRQNIHNPVHRVLATGEATALDNHTLLLARNGSDIPIEASGTPICEGALPGTEQCPIIGVVLVFRDTRERRKAEEAIKRSEERYHSLVDASAQIIWTTPPTGVVTDMPSWREYTGQTLEQVQGWGWLDAIHPDDRARTTKIWNRAVAINGVYETEYRIRRSDGTYQPFAVRGVPVLEADGSVREWVGTCTNISKRKRAEEKLQSALNEKARTASELSGVLAQIAEGVVITDAQGNITFANEVAHRLYGVESLDACEGDINISEYANGDVFFTPEGEPYPAQELPLARAVFHGETVIGQEMMVQRPDGTRIVVQGNAVPLNGEDGIRLGAVLTVRDVTAQRAVMQELVRVNRMKDEFLAILSHELRTPLTPILGWASLLRQTKGENPEVLAQAAEAIERNAETQKRLIDDLLDTTRMMSGKFSIDRRPASCNAIIVTTIESAQRAAAARGIRIEHQLDERLPPVEVDAVRMQQVLWNLLSNSLKFSKDGDTIRVRSRRLDDFAAEDAKSYQPQPTATSWVEVEVSDEGQGIEPEILPHIFELFRQGDSSYTRRHGGLGLGLAITRSLIEMHGGHIEAHSAGVEQGTRFVFRLPLSETPSGETPSG